MKELVIVPEEAALVKEIFDLFTEECWGVTKIAKHMNVKSTTKEGGKWDNKAVRNVLTNHTYAGYNHFKAEDWPEEQRIITPGTHPAIITIEQFNKAQEYRQRKANGHMSKRSFDYPYSGIIKCGRCGATYAGNAAVHGNKKYLSYRCLNQYAKGTCDAPSISERNLNELVFRHIELVEDGFQEPKPKARSKVNIKKELAVSQKRRHNWMMALGDGKLSGDDYAVLIEGEDARIAKIRKEAEPDPEQTIPMTEIRNAFNDLKTNWHLLTSSTQKQIIQSLFKKITIKKSDDWHIVDMLTV
ncbi:recombinase family protein [Paenibacillus sp. SYP-B4298]|uniref:recombinase family protein n=1 Tax=Paenibacillus sp. SYP-B4298 TaxID=2996034 RepID=UPI0022DD0008|nr:recombinase family protein [Paenibacillus sp. SYP-B4298]